MKVLVMLTKLCFILLVQQELIAAATFEDPAQTCSVNEECSISLDGKPSLKLLHLLNGKDGKEVRVIQEIGADYSKFGSGLISDNGALVGAYVDQCNKGAECINERILKKWLEGGGVGPVTWKNLIDILRNHVELRELADELDALIEENEYHLLGKDYTIPALVMDKMKFRRVVSLMSSVKHILDSIMRTDCSSPVECDLLNNVTTHFSSIETRLFSWKIRTGIVGVTKAGKSTFLNALLGGKSFLPSSIQPQTAKEVSIIHDLSHPNGALFGVRTVGDKPELLAKGVDNISMKLGEINAQERTPKSTKYSKLTLHAPLQFLEDEKDIQFEFSDTPGLNEAGVRFTDQGKRALKDMAAFIIVLDLKQMKTDAESKLFKNLIRYHSDLLSKLNRILVIVNYYGLTFKEYDTHSLTESEIPQYVSDYLGDRYILGETVPASNIFPFSALWALIGKQWCADPTSLFQDKHPKTRYNEAINMLEFADYNVDHLHVIGEPNAENIKSLSTKLIEFSKIKDVEQKMKEVFLTNGENILFESAVGDSLTEIGNIFGAIEKLITEERVQEKQEHFQTCTSLKATYSTFSTRIIDTLNPSQLQQSIKENTRTTLSTLTHALGDKMDSVIISKLMEKLHGGTHQHEDKSHIQSQIVSAKPNILKSAIKEVEMSWLSVVKEISVAESAKIRYVLTEFRLELVSTLTKPEVVSKSSSFRTDFVDDIHELSKLITDKLSLVADVAESLIPAIDPIDVMLDYNGIGREEVEDDNLKKKYIVGKTQKYRMEDRKVCGGRRYGFVGPKECTKYQVAIPYKDDNFSPDFSSIENAFKIVGNGWVELFSSAVDRMIENRSHTVSGNVQERIGPILSTIEDKLEQHLASSKSMVKKSEEKVKLLEGSFEQLEKLKTKFQKEM